MRGLCNARRLARVLANRSPFLLDSVRVESTRLEAKHLWRSYHTVLSSGIMSGNHLQHPLDSQQIALESSMGLAVKKLYSSEAGASETPTTAAVKEVYDQMLKSISEKRSAPPNALLWSLVEKCATNEDIQLLFDILQRLRIFRLSNLRIHDNFNSCLCQEVTKACIRAGATDYGKKALWKHNVYGLTPSVGPANQLLLYAEHHKDGKLMAGIMELLKKNDLPLQPSTADIVFRICSDTENSGLLCKYAKRFAKAGVKLRKSSIDMWMVAAANRGDVDSLWKAEKMRSESKKQHTLVSGFACVKGFLLEHKPEDAVGIIETLTQTLPEEKGQSITSQIQELVNEWPLKVIKYQKKEDRKALVTALQTDIVAMIAGLSKFGLEVNVDMENLTSKTGVLS